MTTGWKAFVIITFLTSVASCNRGSGLDAKMYNCCSTTWRGAVEEMWNWCQHNGCDRGAIYIEKK
jgi:hypothetical protein